MQVMRIITIETDHVLHQQQVQVPAGQSEITLKVPAGLTRHDAYISAFVITPTSAHSKNQSTKTQLWYYSFTAGSKRAKNIVKF